MSESEGTVPPLNAEVTVEYQHSRPLTSCHWEPRSRFIFFGAEDNLVHRFELATGTVVSLSLHDSWVRSFASSPDGQVLYSGGYDGRLVHWPAAEEVPAPVRVIEGHEGWIRAVASSPCGRWIATCGNDRLVKLWDAADGGLVQEFSGHQWHVYNVIFLPDSQHILSCDLKGVVRRNDVQSGESSEVATVEQLHGYDTTFRADIGGARGIAVHPSGNLVALGGITNVSNAFAGVGEIAVALVDPTTGAIERILESQEKTRGTIWGVAYHPSGYWLGVSGGGGGWLHAWSHQVPADENGDGENEEGGEESQDAPSTTASSPEASDESGDVGTSVVIQHEAARVKLPQDGRGMSLSPDARQLAVAHADRYLRIYQFSE
jgi:WD40 repeat protein